MPAEPVRFPAGSIRCQRGDYVLQRGPDGRIRVYRVQDLVTLSRLVPFGADALIEERHILDSERPAFMDEIVLLLTPFDRDFGSVEETVAAVQTDALGSATDARCLDIRRFPTDSSEVYRPTARGQH